MLRAADMHAVRLAGHGGAEAFTLSEAPSPHPEPEELLVQVRAAALNRADLLQALGHYPPPPHVSPDVPGLEYAGVVMEVGERAEGFRVGDRVMGLVGGGAMAEQVTAHARTVLAIPKEMPFTSAAAVPEAFLTSMDALFSQGGLTAGERVLIHAAASGVGTAACQLASAAGAWVCGTVRSPNKQDVLKELGVHHIIVCAQSEVRFADSVREASGGAGIDLALELVGGRYFPETLRALAPKGRLMLVGMLGGREAPLDMQRVLHTRIRIQGTVMRNRPLEERIAVAQAAIRQLLPLLREKRVHPVVHAVFPFSRVREAVEVLAGDQAVGKVVLSWED